MVDLQICQEPDADAVLSQNDFALVAGMLLDQQYPMEHAFRGPHKVQQRMGSFTPETVAAADPEQFAALCAETPAVHRFPGSMAARLQDLARLVIDDYEGETARIWTEAKDAKELDKRIRALPGFGAQKAKIFQALLAKQLGVRLDGWEKVTGDYALEGHRSVADVVDADTLQKVRDHKKAMKAAAKTK